MASDVTLDDVIKRGEKLGVFEEIPRIDIIMSLDYAQDVFDFSYDDLMELNDFSFMHDLIGCHQNLDKTHTLEARSGSYKLTEKDFRYFTPRAATYGDAKRLRNKQEAIRESIKPNKSTTKSTSTKDAR